jgi:hypothetical protein
MAHLLFFIIIVFIVIIVPFIVCVVIFWQAFKLQVSWSRHCTCITQLGSALEDSVKRFGRQLDHITLISVDAVQILKIDNVLPYSQTEGVAPDFISDLAESQVLWVGRLDVKVASADAVDFGKFILQRSILELEGEGMVMRARTRSCSCCGGSRPRTSTCGPRTGSWTGFRTGPRACLWSFGLLRLVDLNSRPSSWLRLRFWFFSLRGFSLQPYRDDRAVGQFEV